MTAAATPLLCVLIALRAACRTAFRPPSAATASFATHTCCCFCHHAGLLLQNLGQCYRSVNYAPAAVCCFRPRATAAIAACSTHAPSRGPCCPRCCCPCPQHRCPTAPAIPAAAPAACLTCGRGCSACGPRRPPGTSWPCQGPSCARRMLSHACS